MQKTVGSSYKLQTPPLLNPICLLLLAQASQEACFFTGSVAFYHIAVDSSVWAGHIVFVVSIFLFFLFLSLSHFLLTLLLFIFLLLILLLWGVPYKIGCVRTVFGVSVHVACDLQSNAEQGGSKAAKLTSIVTRKKRVKRRVKSPTMHQVPLKAYTNLHIVVAVAVTADCFFFDV